VGAAVLVVAAVTAGLVAADVLGAAADVLGAAAAVLVAAAAVVVAAAAVVVVAQHFSVHSQFLGVNLGLTRPESSPRIRKCTKKTKGAGCY